MATPRIWQAAKAALRELWPHALTILATDGGTNDGNGVEVTGTSAGAVNVSAAQLPAALGPTTPALSTSVTGSLAATQASIDDVTARGSAAAFGSLAAGPGGIVVANTSAPGGPNVRIDGAPTATHGVQLAPGEKWIFAVTNANQLKHIAESGSPTVSAAQA
ncbi:MAG TPA: hypothetical protein PLT35_13085 [Vicinamibacterales bacterium]|mgnify:CR=1 FL=1|nr:hypothetical protein [Vicinamibacterales bacterium]HOQ61816.1 hypothetical protein [Vicinamibacterales bacterium]